MGRQTVIRSGDRITGQAFASRSVVYATHGMAATSQPLATQTALDVLRRGGHAVDAAIAANAVLGLVEPVSCGLGGDLFAMIWDAQEKTLHGLNGSGRTPLGATAADIAARSPGGVPMTGALSVSVPGAVDAWAELHSRFGRLPWADLFEPTIRYARDGFPVTDLTAHYWRIFAPRLKDQPGFQATWLAEGLPPKAGQRIGNPGLAACLEVIAAQGRDAFYSGGIAARIARAVQLGGGFLQVRDLEAHTTTWDAPVSTSYRGHDVWQLPPNGQGIAVLQMLNQLEGFDLENMGFGSASHLHTLAEVKKLVFEDRARWYADPAFAEVPTAELISKAYAAERRRSIDPNRAASRLVAGHPALAEGDTVCIVTADKDRNMVSMMQSIFMPMGSGVTPEGLGFLLQNRAALTTLEDGHANVYAPGKRPFHTIIPSFVTRDGEPYLAFGVMGGEAQPQIETQVLVNLIDFEMGLQEAGDAPRLLHQGSSQPTGAAASPTGGRVLLESGFPYASVRGLLARGHDVGYVQGLYGGYQAIRHDPKSGVYAGASEFRQDGQAAGY